MKLTVQQLNNVKLVHLEGEFGMTDPQVVADELQPIVADSGAKLAVDLSGLSQINSEGLNELINLVTRARLTDSRVVLISPSPFVRQVFSITRLDQWFDIVEDVEGAVALLES
jgi:anti-anti-sigma factor